MVKGMYRIHDPLENFKIRVTLREVFNISKISENKRPDQICKIRVISWQEKIFGPRDISDYYKHKQTAKGKKMQIENRRHLQRIEKSGKQISDLIENPMIYTYIDEDDFNPAKRQVLNLESTAESYLGPAMDALNDQTPPEDARQAKVLKRSDWGSRTKTMHICFATDIDKESVTKASTFWNHEPVMSEHVLCTIELHKDGLIEISPPFSSILMESERIVLAEESYMQIVPNVFLDEATVQAGAKKGFRLATYRIRTQVGAEFEYTIENVHDVHSPLEYSDLCLREGRIDAANAAESRGLSGVLGSDWTQKPPPDPWYLSIQLYGEVISATGFGDNDPLYVKYTVMTPVGWKHKSDFDPDSVSQDGGAGASGAIKGKQGGHVEGCTQLSTAVYEIVNSCSFSVMSNQLSNSCGVHPYRISAPHLPISYFQTYKLTGVVSGLSLLIVTCLAILFGPAYPFWIVPSLCFFVVLGNGTPGCRGQTAVVVDDIARNPVIVGAFIQQPTAAFGHIFSETYMAKESESNVSPSRGNITIIFEVFSVSPYGRHTLEGYGTTELHQDSDSSEIDISTWKPVGNHHSSLCDFFMGGGAQLSNLMYAGVPNRQLSSLSRFGSCSESSGSIRFRHHTITCDHRKSKDYTSATNDLPAEQASKQLTVRKTVEDILSGHKSSLLLQKSMSKKGLDSPMSLAESPGHARSTPQEKSLNDIIARARAKYGRTPQSGLAKSVPNTSDASETSSLLGKSEEGIERMDVPQTMVERLESAGIMKRRMEDSSPRSDDKEEAGTPLLPPTRERKASNRYKS